MTAKGLVEKLITMYFIAVGQGDAGRTAGQRDSNRVVVGLSLRSLPDGDDVTLTTMTLRIG